MQALGPRSVCEKTAPISIRDLMQHGTRLASDAFPREQMMCSQQDIEQVHRPDAIVASAPIATKTRHERDAPIYSAAGCRLRALYPWICALAGWGAVIAAGCTVLEVYATSPGAAGRSLADWPQNCVIPIDGRHPTLLIFLHPLCPCSSASIAELSEVVGRHGDRVRPHAVVLRTDALEREGAGLIERSLADVPGITTWHDDGGALARRFGVLTSGHVLLYDRSGRLTFSGGITASRGHRGENFGKSALVAAILGDPCDRSALPVFGCPLFEFQSNVAEEARQ